MAICGHSEPFSQTWPTSGMTRDGSAYELPTLELLTSDSASLSSHSLLGTPMASTNAIIYRDRGRGFLGDDVVKLIPATSPLSVAAVSVAEGEPLLQSDPLAPPKHYPTMWGPYAHAVITWENIIGEKAPPPTTQGADGRHRLNPELPRWMMGFPPGWLDGLTPAQQLKAVGNAVCQQQAELALRILLGDS